MLAGIAIGWISGLLFVAVGGQSPRLALVTMTMVAAAGLALRGRGLEARLWVVVVSGLAFAAGASVGRPVFTPCTLRGEVDVRATVERVRFAADKADVWLRVKEARIAPTAKPSARGLLLRVHTPLHGAPAVRSLVRFHGRVWPATELHNPSIRPQLPRHGAGACWALAEGDGLDVVSEPLVARRLAGARARIRRRLVEGLPEDVAGVARALVLGDGGAIPYADRRVVASVGLAHLFAVSGLHIALVSGTLVALLHATVRLFVVRIAPIRLAAALGIPLTLLHAELAGAAPSAKRAAVTAAMTWLLVAFDRRPSPVAVAGAAALLLSATQPAMAGRPAFLLSIVATAAILSAPTLGRRRARRIAGAATVSARTLVATAPLVWWWFGGVPLVGWLVNLLVLPWGTLVVVPLAHLFAVVAPLGCVADSLGSWLTAAVRLLLLACDWFSRWTITKTLPPLDEAQGAVVLGTCMALLGAQRWRFRFAALAVGAILWVIAEQRLIAVEQPRGRVRVTYVDVAQGDAILVDLPDGASMLIDTGRGARHPAARELLRLLRERRREHIDRVVITHGHPDHFGALSNLLGSIAIGEIWVNGQLLAEERDGQMHALLRRARRRGTRVTLVGDVCGQTHRHEEATLHVLWPCPRYDPELDLNDNSIVLRLVYGHHAFLFTGDLEREAEQRMLAQGLLRPVDVLKAAHHGSRTSTTQSFVDAVRPSVAIVSSGAQNRYGHPAPEVIRRLERAGVRVLRTDAHGGIIVSTDGQSLSVQPTKNGPAFSVGHSPMGFSKTRYTL